MLRRFSRLPLPTRVASIITALVVIAYGSSLAHDVVWRRAHPAPLGRTKTDVDRVLAGNVPVGTPLDSALSYITRAGLEHSVARSQTDLRSYRESDSLYAGGPVISAVERDVSSSFVVSESIHVALYFDASDKLVRRKVESWLTGP